MTMWTHDDDTPPQRVEVRPWHAVHHVTGLTPEEYEQRLRDEGSMPGTLEPRMHAHPALGITMHAHGPTVEAARTPHTHRAVATWDMTPVPVWADTE